MCDGSNNGTKSRAKTVKLLLGITTAVGSLWWSVLHQILDKFSIVRVWGFLYTQEHCERVFVRDIY